MTFYAGAQLLLKGGRATMLEIAHADALLPLVHSVKSRIKSERSMKRKLSAKLVKANDEGQPFGITRDTFFEVINDAIGVRILHLSFTEFEAIHRMLLELFKAGVLGVLEIRAYTYDPEKQKAFGDLGLETEVNERYYTSVHYIVGQHTWTAEVQVRTLGEEWWGEVDHKFNYPDQHASLPCREQIRALALQVQGCSRLVDAIYRTADENNA